MKIHIGGLNSHPFLWIKVTNPENGKGIIAYALIDTGATYNAFPAECASRLGHNLKSMSPKTICTANNKTKAYPHTSKVEVLGVFANGYPDKDKILYSLPEQRIDYTEGLGQFLLGQNNFLSEFVLTIDYPKKSFSIRHPFFAKKKKS